MITLQKHPTFFGQSPRRFAKATAPAQGKSVLFSTDIDGTLIDEHSAFGTRHTARLLKKHRDQVVLHLSTGRGLTFFKHVAPQLKRFQVKYLSVNNGEQLYINARNLPADQWIKSLSYGDRCQGWEKAIQARSGWSLDKVKQTIADVLQSEGFSKPNVSPASGRIARTRKLGKTGTIVFETLSDQSSYRLVAENGSYSAALRGYGTRLRNKIVDKLRQKGILSYFKEVKHRASTITYLLYSCLPKSIDKSSVIPFILRDNPNIQAVITAGNEYYNDREMLEPDRFSLDNGQAIPNYPIVVGDEEKLLRHMKNHPQVVHVPSGRIFWGIDKQLGKTGLSS